MKKPKYQKGEIVKTEEGVLVITDVVKIEDKIVYKVEKIKVWGTLLMKEDDVFYKVSMEQLCNERVLPDGMFIEENQKANEDNSR